MGEHSTHTATNEETRLNFTRHLLDDVEALEQMIGEGKIESGITRIGAEQEFLSGKQKLATRCQCAIRS